MAGGAHTVVPYEAWIARPVPRRFQSAHYRPHGFERTALFATNDEPATIKDRIPTGRTKASRKWQRMQLLIAACLRVASGCVRLRKKRENFS